MKKAKIILSLLILCMGVVKMYASCVDKCTEDCQKECDSYSSLFSRDTGNTDPRHRDAGNTIDTCKKDCSEECSKNCNVSVRCCLARGRERFVTRYKGIVCDIPGARAMPCLGRV